MRSLKSSCFVASDWFLSLGGLPPTDAFRFALGDAIAAAGEVPPDLEGRRVDAFRLLGIRGELEADDAWWQPSESSNDDNLRREVECHFF